MLRLKSKDREVDKAEGSSGSSVNYRWAEDPRSFFGD